MKTAWTQINILVVDDEDDYVAVVFYYDDDALTLMIANYCFRRR